MNATTGVYAVQLNAPLVYAHHSSREWQGEVVLLSRRITFSGSDSGDFFGGHTMVAGSPSAIGRFAGVAARRMGQKNILARYPFHFHGLQEAGSASYFKVPYAFSVVSSL